MATNLGTLTLNLVAQTGSYTQGLQRAERQTEQSTENMAESFDLVGSSVAALSGLIAGISVASIAALAAEAINTGNEIKKLADLSNASTKQFQYYAVGAKMAGIEIDQFADQMKDMQDRIGDFQQTGGGPLADFFTGIAPLVGVTIDQFQKLSGPDAMQLFYNSLEKVFATENDIKFYMESIISDSSKLIPLLRDGGKGFDEWGAKAELAGAIMSDSMIQQMDDAKKNLQAFDLEWQGLKTTLINDAMPAISSVIKNIDVVTNVLAVGGAFLVGIYIPTIYGAITALVEKTNTQIADIRATQLANEIAAQRAARIVQLTEIELNNARVQAARMTGMARLAFMERTLIPLEQQYTAAIAANTVAQNANNASKSMAATIGRGLMGIIGGPVGLGVLVAGAAASYLLLRDNTDKAAKSLNENGIAVADVVTKYQQLTEAQQRNQLRAETSSLIDLTTKYKDSKNELVAMTLNLYRSGEASANVAKDISALAMQYKNKEITAETLAKKINELNGVTAEGKAKVDAQTDAIKTANVEMDRQKSVVQAMIQENQKLAGSHEKVADSVGKQIIEMMRLTSEQKAYVLQVQSDTVRAKFIEDQVKKGVSRPRAEFQADAYAGAKVDLAKPNEVPRLVAEAEQQAWVLSQAEKAREEADKKADEVAKKRESDRKKASDNAIKLSEKQSNMQKALIYDFSSASRKMYIDYVKQISDIQEANFKPSEKGQYLAAAKARYDDEILLYKMQQAYELSEHKLTDEAKAHATYLIDQQIINNRSDLNKDEKSKYLASLDEKYAYQKRLLNLESNQRLNDASQAFQTDMQNMAAKYEFERQQILLNKSIGDDERKALINASRITENKEFFSSRDSAWDSYQNAIGVDTSLEQAASQRAEAIQAAYEWQLITQEEYQQKMLESQQKYEAAKLQTTLSSGADIMGSLTSIAKNVAGENSSLYKAMFAMEKGMAVARSVMAIQAALAQASANPFPMNLAAMATVAAQTANIVGTIKGVQMPQGMAHNGIDNIPKEGTWLLDKGERVVDSRTNADLKNYLANGGGSGGDVNITVNVTDSGVTTQSNQSDQKQLGQMIGNAVRTVIRQEQRQGGLLAK